MNIEHVEWMRKLGWKQNGESWIETSVTVSSSLNLSRERKQLEDGEEVE